MLTQVVLFSKPVTARIGSLGPPIYVASTAMVLAAIVRQPRASPGCSIVALGAASNLTAILANGGYMPAGPGAIAVLWHGPSDRVLQQRHHRRPGRCGR